MAGDVRWRELTHCRLPTAKNEYITARQLRAVFVLRRMKDFTIDVLNARDRRNVWLHMQTGAHSDVRAVEDALIVAIRHVFDSVPPLVTFATFAIERRDTHNPTAEVYIRCEAKMINIGFKVLHVLW
jgi:hypothetical protein